MEQDGKKSGKTDREATGLKKGRQEDRMTDRKTDRQSMNIRSIYSLLGRQEKALLMRTMQVGMAISSKKNSIVLFLIVFPPAPTSNNLFSLYNKHKH